jgi:hypothetical protein
LNRDQKVLEIIASDSNRLDLLRLVHSLQLPDCWVGAGFVRNAVWDHLHGRPPGPVAGDVDVIWYDPHRATPLVDLELETTLRGLNPDVLWSVKNQARMHARNGDRPYSSSADAMRHWVETATAVAIRWRADNSCEVCAPLGLDDLFALILRPGFRFTADKYSIYQERAQAKRWQEQWPLLRQAPASTVEPDR